MEGKASNREIRYFQRPALLAVGSSLGIMIKFLRNSSPLKVQRFKTKFPFSTVSTARNTVATIFVTTTLWLPRNVVVDLLLTHVIQWPCKIARR